MNANGWTFDMKVRGGECRECPLYSTAHQVVVHRGSYHPKVLFVGEAPGADEDQSGIPFTGPSGELLNQFIDSHPAVHPCAVVNIVLHRPPDNVFKKSYGLACTSFMVEKIQKLQPEVIVALGNNATDWFRIYDDHTGGVLVGGHPARFISIYHPAAILRRRDWRNKWEAQWRKVVEMAKR